MEKQRENNPRKWVLMLRVRASTPRDSKLWPEVVKLTQARGLSHVGILQLPPGDPNPWTCHKCEGKFPVPLMGEDDVLVDCPGCGYPFLIINISTAKALQVELVPGFDGED